MKISSVLRAEILCPAKINLSLAVLGRREDGFHDLHSIVAQTQFGDNLSVEWKAEGDADELVIEGPEACPVKGNSVLRMLELAREEVALDGSFHCHLQKNIPIEAGLGGGSSDAVGMLKILRQFFPESFSEDRMQRLAAACGSDCPLFLSDGAVIMEGRGERVWPLSSALSARIENMAVLLIKPPWSTSTPWAFAELAKRKAYADRTELDRCIDGWEADDSIHWPEILNSFEPMLLYRFPAYQVLFSGLTRVTGARPRITGSGSALFLSCGSNLSLEAVKTEVERICGSYAKVISTVLK